LGPAKIRQSDHVFLHLIDLEPIRENIKTVENQIITLDALVKDLNNEFKLRFLALHNYITEKYHTISEKYNSLSKNRLKRSLIDGLGTIIHSITGNLDQEDARRYDQAIKTLQKNQNKITHHINKAITLNKIFVENYNATLSAIVSNQDQLNSKISEIIRQVNISEQEFIGFVKLDSAYKLLEINVQILFGTLSDLETATSLSTKHIAYRNLISFSNLEHFISVLRKYYSPEQLITSDVTESRVFYNFLDVSSYFSDNRLVFVVKIPIFFKSIFTYYNLFPIPTSNNTIIIPNKPYLVMNENEYQYLENKCNRIGNTHYCQEEASIQDPKRSPDCVYTLIRTQQSSPQCQYHQIKIDHAIFEQINDEYYVLISPQSTRLHIQCTHDEYLKINGAHLLKLPENCSAATEKVTFTNIHNRIYGTPVKLFTFNIYETNVSNRLQPLKLENVNLKELHKTVGLIEREQQPIQLENITHQEHLYWTTPLYIIIFLVACYLIYVKVKKTETETGTATAAAEMEPPIPIQIGNLPRSFLS
jgi:hypothetical protein